TANGVTTVQNMAGQPFHLALRKRTANGEVLGPRIITAGPTTAQVGVETPEAAERVVAEQKALGYDMIKMYGGRNGIMTPETYHRLVTTAHAAGMRVVGHAARNLPFQTVLQEKQNSIDHMEEVLYTERSFDRLLKAYVDVQFDRAAPGVRDSLARIPVPDFGAELKPEIAAFAASAKKAGIAITPNIVFFRNIGWMGSDSIFELMRAPELAYATPGQRLNWSPMLNNYRNGWGDNLALMTAYFAQATRLAEAITRALNDAGVPVMTGTDSEYLGAQPGFGLHTELEIFQHLGMTPIDALKAATLTPARVMQISDSVGTVEKGKIADLVLLNADPTKDVKNTREIAGVFTAGRWMPRAPLDSRLDSLTKSYAPLQRELARFVDALEKNGAAAALDVYRASAQRTTIAKTVERVINSYGYRLLGEKKTAEALATFKLNTEAFPAEYNTWDSLAEAYMNSGERDLAIKYYQKVLELHPGDQNATEMLRRLGR
ncbi:MAG TPA: amidohydrolase family protein, partial [Longimicrobiales bacterium]|nr:amidohydrolase family protein [Longimicrobiales bacterium]